MSLAPIPWTDDELDTLRRLYAEGLCDTAISARMPGRTAKAIMNKRVAQGWCVGTFAWSSENVAQLKAWFTLGLSATEIAKRFGKPCTRNAVIGKQYRLGLRRTGDGQRITMRLGSKNAARIGRARAAKAKTQPVAPPKPAPQLRVPETPERALGILEIRTFQCRYPVSGEGADTLFCGRRVKPESSYCPACAKIVFSPKPVKSGAELARSLRRYAA